MKQLDFTAIHAIFKILSTSLGPKGLDKVIVNIQKSDIFSKNVENEQFDTDDLIITNDGATIMKSLPITHPLGIILKQLSNSIDTQVGDGTTSGVILACKLLEESEKLLHRNYHPNLIIKAYTIAYEQCKIILNSNSIELTDIPIDKDIQLDDISSTTTESTSTSTSTSILKQIVSTSLSSKILNNYIDQFTKYCFQVVNIIRDTSNGSIFNKIQSNINYIKLLGSNISSTKLTRGIILNLNLNNSNLINQQQQQQNGNSDISLLKFNSILINFDIGYIDESSFRIIQYNNLNFNKRELIENEKRQLEIKQAKEFIGNIKNYSNGSDDIIIFSSKRISLICLKLLQDNGIKTIFNLNEDQLKNIQLVTGCSNILNSITTTISKSTLSPFGNCNLNIIIEKQSEYYIEIINESCNICTFLLKAPSVFIIEEIQRSLNDSISILSLIIESKKIISGGGSNEIQLSIGLESFLKSNKFKDIMKKENEQDVIKFINCIKSFSKALKIIPILLIDNAGYDSITLFQQLLSIHRDITSNNNKESSGDNCYTGINLNNGLVSNMLQLGIIESLKGKEIILKMVIDTVSMILKIDQLIKN